MRSDGSLLFITRVFDSPDLTRISAHAFDLNSSQVTLQGTLNTNRLLVSGAIESTEGLKIGVGGVELAGSISHKDGSVVNPLTIATDGYVNFRAPSVLTENLTVEEDLIVYKDITIASGGTLTSPEIEATNLIVSTSGVFGTVFSTNSTLDGLTTVDLTTSGLTVDHGPATISGAAIATEPYVDSELTSLSGIITSDLTTLSGVLQSQITNSDLDIAGDMGLNIDITDGEVLTIQGGTSGNIVTQVGGTAVNIEMSDDISLSGTLAVGDLTTVSGLTVSNLTTTEDLIVNDDLTVYGSLALPFLSA
jgi:hypothetical protein